MDAHPSRYTDTYAPSHLVTLNSSTNGRAAGICSRRSCAPTASGTGSCRSCTPTASRRTAYLLPPQQCGHVLRAW